MNRKKPATIATRVTAFREAKSMTRYALAKAADLGYATVDAIEREGDESELRLKTLRAIAKALGVTVGELVD